MNETLNLESSLPIVRTRTSAKIPLRKTLRERTERQTAVRFLTKARRVTFIEAIQQLCDYVDPTGDKSTSTKIEKKTGSQQQSQLVQQQVVAKLAERQQEIDALEHRVQQLQQSIAGYQDHIARVHFPELEMKQQLDAVEKFVLACSGLAAALTLFNHALNPATTAVWQKGISAATDAAHAMRLHVERCPALTVIRSGA